MCAHARAAAGRWRNLPGDDGHLHERGAVAAAPEGDRARVALRVAGAYAAPAHLHEELVRAQRADGRGRQTVVSRPVALDGAHARGDAGVRHRHAGASWMARACCRRADCRPPRIQRRLEILEPAVASMMKRAGARPPPVGTRVSVTGVGERAARRARSAPPKRRRAARTGALRISSARTEGRGRGGGGGGEGEGGAGGVDERGESAAARAAHARIRAVFPLPCDPTTRTRRPASRCSGWSSSSGMLSSRERGRKTMRDDPGGSIWS